MHSGNELNSFASPESHDQQPSLARLAYELTNGSSSNGNAQGEHSAYTSASYTLSELVAAREGRSQRGDRRKPKLTLSLPFPVLPFPPSAHASSSSSSNGLVSIEPFANPYINNPSPSSSSNLAGPSAPLPPPPQPAPLVPEAATSTTPTKRPRRTSSTSGPTPSPKTKRRKSDSLKPESIPSNPSAEELKLNQAISSLKSNVPALRAFL